MGQISRTLCVSIPMLFTLGSVIALAIIFASGASPGNLNGVYFFRADLRNLTTVASGKIADIINTYNEKTGTQLESSVLKALNVAKAAANIQDGYSIGMWNYCSGPYVNDGFAPNYCSPKSTDFYFNPIEIWKLNETGVTDALPSSLTTALDTYRKVSHWNIIAHIVALSLVSASFVVGFLGVFYRRFALLVSIFMGVAALFTFAAAATTSAMYAFINAAFKTGLEPYGVYASIGARGYAVSWIAFAMAVVAFLFWTLTSCCCGVDRKEKRRNKKHEDIQYHKMGAPPQTSEKGSPTGMFAGPKKKSVSNVTTSAVPAHYDPHTVDPESYGYVEPMKAQQATEKSVASDSLHATPELQYATATGYSTTDAPVQPPAQGYDYAYNNASYNDSQTHYTDPPAQPYDQEQQYGYGQPHSRTNPYDQYR